MTPMKKINLDKEKLRASYRLIFFIIGLGGLIFVAVYSINWDVWPLPISLGGANVTIHFWVAILILGGIIFSSLLKSALVGKNKIDI